jgi:alkanesulfonate monooxygenase SsuD/methylene tetrahydromethanopterin reductase-like flavin-dependent oxidoreductase (luciferase family)
VIIDTEFNSAAQVPMKESLEGALLAEKKGFGCVWKGEANGRDPMVLLSAMAARTSKLQLGTAIYHIFGRGPVTLGIQAAAFNELSDGRLILGLGVGNPTIAGWHGSDFDRPLRRMREYVDVVRLTYSRARVDYQGEYHRLSGFKLAYEPPPYPLAIWLAALGPQMARLAGKIADGVLINMATPDMVRELVGCLHEGAAQAGRDPSSLGVLAKIRVSINEDIERAKQALKKVCTFYALSYGYRDLLGRMGWGEVVEAVQRSYKEGGFDAARRQIPDEMLDGGVPMLPARDIREVRARLRPFEEAGATRCDVAYVVSTDDTWGEIRRFVEAADFTQ